MSASMLNYHLSQTVQTGCSIHVFLCYKSIHYVIRWFQTASVNISWHSTRNATKRLAKHWLFEGRAKQFRFFVLDLLCVLTIWGLTFTKYYYSNRSSICLGGHSTTTLTNFYPIFTPVPPQVDKDWCFTYYLLGFSTGWDISTFRDRGTDVSSLSPDKGTTG